MSIDFLIGLTLFAGVFIFVAQFAMGTILPFTTASEEGSVVSQKVSEGIVSDEIKTGETGTVDTDPIKNGQPPFDKQQTMRVAFGIPEKYKVNVTVTNLAGDSVVAGAGPSANVTTTSTVYTMHRIVYDEDDDKNYRIKVRLW